MIILYLNAKKTRLLQKCFVGGKGLLLTFFEVLQQPLRFYFKSRQKVYSPGWRILLPLPGSENSALAP